jgi:indolepyruvate ferredoxin oxidoreductase alpha subunit
VRALERLGLADVYGSSKVPLYVMNVAYPVVPAEVTRFCAGKKAVLLVEEGQPNFIEQTLATVLRQADLQTVLHGKDFLAPAGEYTGAEVLKGVRAFLEHYGRVETLRSAQGDKNGCHPERSEGSRAGAKVIPLAPLAEVVHGRPPGLLHRAVPSGRSSAR